MIPHSESSEENKFGTNYLSLLSVHEFKDHMAFMITMYHAKVQAERKIKFTHLYCHHLALANSPKKFLLSTRPQTHCRSNGQRTCDRNH